MKNHLLLIAPVFLIGCNLISSTQVTPINSLEKAQETTSSESATDSNLSGYTQYSKASFDQASNQKRILFFHASWCPTCKSANEEILASLDQIPSDAVIFKTDYDSQSSLKQKYGITYQHTFVLVDKEGEAVEVWNGGGITEIVEMLEKNS